MQNSKTICIHAATSPTSYQLVHRIAAGDVFGKDVALHLRLLDTEVRKVVLSKLIRVALMMNILLVPPPGQSGCSRRRSDGARRPRVPDGFIG